MNRKLVGGVIALVVVLFVVWLVAFRGGSKSEETSGGRGSDRAAKIDPVTGQPIRSSAVDAVVRSASGRWTLDPDPDGPLTMEGQATGPDGKGMGSVQVFINTAPPRSVTTNDDGTFTIDKLLGRTYRLTAKSAELIGGPTVCKLTAKSDPCRITLGEGAAVEVTVVDEAKVPVAGAEVHEGDRREGTATTDANGFAKLRPIHPGWITVVATHARYAPASAFTTVGTAGALAKVTVVLRKGYPVSGRVVDEAGKPIENAHVYPAGIWFDEDRATNPTVSDATGAFTVEAMPPGTHTLAAVDREHAAGRTQVTVADKPVSGLEIVMKAGASIAGTVVDTAGKPVPFATVQVAGTNRQRWQESRRATTDDKGAFEVRGLPRSKLLARAQLESSASAIADVDLTEKDVRDLKLTLDVAGRISGFVVNDTGAPVPEVQVQAFPDLVRGDAKAAALASMTAAQSDGVGAFTFEGLPEGTYRLSVTRSNARGWGNWENNTKASTGDKDVRVVLPSPATVVGKITLKGGSAPKLANVQIGFQPSTPAYDGELLLKDVTPGTYTLTLRGPEFTQYVQHDLVIPAGKTTDLGTLVVQRGRRLAGKVVDSSGRAVPGVKVKLAEMLFAIGENEDQWESFEENAGVRTAMSDQDGAFVLTGIPSEKAMTVGAGHPTAGRSIGLTIPEGNEDPAPVTLALKGYGSISGIVTMKGEARSGVSVTQTTKGGGAQIAVAQTDDNGAYRLPKVPEGNHVLQAMLQGMGSFKATTVNVTVTAGAESKVNIVIPIGKVTLAVTVKALPGNKVDWAQVFLLNSGAATPATGKEMIQQFMGGGAVGMKFWFGADTPQPEFDELLAGDYNLCTIPITGGKFEDAAFQRKLQENMQSLKVYCKPVKLTDLPPKQPIIHEVPSMTPFPAAPAPPT